MWVQNSTHNRSLLFFNLVGFILIGFFLGTTGGHSKLRQTIGAILRHQFIHSLQNQPRSAGTPITQCYLWAGDTQTSFHTRACSCSDQPRNQKFRVHNTETVMNHSTPRLAFGMLTFYEVKLAEPENVCYMNLISDIILFQGICWPMVSAHVSTGVCVSRCVLV